MSKIIDFLQKHSVDSEDYDPINKESKTLKLSMSYEEIVEVIESPSDEKANVIRIKVEPKLEKGQIWLCKQQYIDAFGNEVVGNTPYLVLVVSNVDKLINEPFIRVQPISPFTECIADDDTFINDNSIIGYNFIIETWNEQPILKDILSEFVAVLDSIPATLEVKDLCLTKEQQEFRKAEIKNTGYLRQSISSYVEFNEHNEESQVLVNINNNVVFLDNFRASKVEAEAESHYLRAAKMGNLNNRPTYVFENTVEGVDIKIIFIREDDDSYVLSVKKPEKIQLKDSTKNILKQTKLNIYDLKSGLYFIHINGIENKIRIILK